MDILGAGVLVTCSANAVPDPVQVVPVKLINLMALRFVLKLKSILLQAVCVPEEFITGCSCWLRSGPMCSSEDAAGCRGLSLSGTFGSVCAFGWEALAGKALLPFHSQFLITASDVTVQSQAAVCRAFWAH